MTPDGRVLVGYVFADSQAEEPAVWRDGVFEFLVDPTTSQGGRAWAVSDDGETIVGMLNDVEEGIVWDSSGRRTVREVAADAGLVLPLQNTRAWNLSGDGRTFFCNGTDEEGALRRFLFTLPE